MTKEEAIKRFEEWAKCSYAPTREAAQLALSALRAQQEENPPLTLEELREMDGEPVFLTGGWGWRICCGISYFRGYLCMETGAGSGIPMMDYGKTWQAYRRKPEEETV